MKKILLLSALILLSTFNFVPIFSKSNFGGPNLPSVADSNYADKLYEDILKGAKQTTLFGLEKKSDLSKWDITNRAYVAFWNDDIRLASEYIGMVSTINERAKKPNTILEDAAENLVASNSVIIYAFTNLPVEVKQRDKTSASKLLHDVYATINTNIPDSVSKLNGLKKVIEQDGYAKKLGLDLFKLLQVIGSKIIVDYAFEPKDALKTIENSIRGIFLPKDYYTQIGLVEFPGKKIVLDALFNRLDYVVNFSDNGTLWANFSLIKQLYISALNVIESASGAFGKKEPFTKVYNNKQSLNQFLEDESRILKETSKGVDNIGANKPADKNGVAILKLLLKLYGQILEKIKKDFDYRPLIKKELEIIEKGKYDFNTLENINAFLNAANWVRLFGVSEDHNFKTETWQKDFVTNLMGLYDGIITFTKTSERLKRESTNAKDASLKAFNDIAKPLLKKAEGAINQVSSVKAVQTVMKDLLATYKIMLDKFEDDMKNKLGITRLARFKNAVFGEEKGEPGAGEQKQGSEELEAKASSKSAATTATSEAKQSSKPKMTKQDILNSLGTVNLNVDLMKANNLYDATRKLRDIVSVKFVEQSPSKFNFRKYDTYRGNLLDLIVFITEINDLAKNEDRDVKYRKFINDTDDVLSAAQGEIAAITQDEDQESVLKDIMAKFRQFRDEFAKQLAAKLEIKTS